MKKTTTSLVSMISSCMILFAATALLAANGVWNGTVDALWTSSANWSVSPYPSVNDTAFFTNAGNSQTTVDVSGLASIKTITFDSPAVAAYTIGTGAVNSQTLVLSDNGIITLTDTAASNQLFNAGLQLGATMAAGTYTVINSNLTQTLTFNKVFGALSLGGAGAKTLNVNGPGNTTILGDIWRGGATALTLTDNSSGTLTLSGTNTLYTLNLNASSNRVDIGSGTLFLSNGGGTVLLANQNATINGTGTIWLSTGGGDNYADVKPITGKTLVINPSIISDGGFELNDAGTAVLNGINTFALDVYYTGPGGAISVSKIGNRGSTTSNLGRGYRIFMSQNNCKLIYTGIGETSDRLFQLSQNIFTIDQSGPSGKLSFSSSPSVTAGPRNLRLQGSTAAVGEFSAPLSNHAGTLSITKEGTGTWILSGVNTYSGATIVNGGKLLFSSPGTSVNSAVTVNSGALLGGDTPISGNVALSAGGMLAPGDVGTIGTMSLGGNLALNSSTLLLDVSTLTADKVSVFGALTVNSANTIVLSLPDGTLPAGTNTLMTFASLNGTGTFVLSPTYTNASLLVNATSVQLVVSEPGTYNMRWQGSTSGSWDTDLNWTNNSAAVAFTPGDAALFDDSALLFNVTSVSPVLPSSVLFNNSISNYVVAAAIDGTGELFKLGSAAVTLTGANTYAGQTTVASGTLTLGGAGLLGGGNYGMNINNNGVFDYASSAVQTNSGVISGGGDLTLSGSGTLILSGTNMYLGATTVNAGVLKALNASALGTIAVGTTVNAGGTLELGGDITTLAEPLSLLGALSSQAGTNIYGGAVTLVDGASINVGAGSMLSLNAFLANGAYTKEGAGWLKLLVDPNGTGLMTINNGVAELGQASGATESDIVINSGGTLIGNSGDAINRVNSVTVNAGGTYVLRISDTINMFSGAGTLTRDIPGAATLTVGDNNGSSTFSGAIQDGSGMLGLTKTGTGIQTLSGANTYTGLTTVTAGTLSLRGPTALPASSAVSMNAATLQVLQDGSGNNGTISVGNDITLNAGITATIDVGNNGSGNTGNTIAFGALNNGPLGTSYLSTINFTGTNGYLQSFTSLGLSSGTGQGTTLRPTTTSVTILGNVLNRQASGGYDTLTLDGTSANNLIMGVISDAAHYTGQGNGDTRITKSNTSTWTLAGLNTYRGNTTVNGGTLLINGSISANSAVTVASGATLGGSGTINGTVTMNAGGLLAPGDVNAVGTLSMGGTLTLNGNTLTFDISNVATDKVAVAGALTLNNANTVLLTFPAGQIADGTYTLMTFASKTGTGTFELAGAYPNATLTHDNTSLILTVSSGGSSWIKTWRGDLSTSWDGVEQNWLSGVTATNFTTGDAVAFDDTAVNFSVSSAASVDPSSVLFNNSANNYTVSAAMGGTGPLVMSGSGLVTLTGTNTFSGPTIITSGTLTLGGAGLLGNGLYATNIMNNGLFNYAGSVVQTNSGIISGVGSLSVSGSGTLALSGVNTYTGPTVVNAGVLKVLNGSALGTTAGNTTVNAGGTLELEGNVVTLAEPLSLFGTLSSQTGSNTYAGVVSLQTASAIDVGSGSKLIFTANTPNLGDLPFSKTGEGLLRLLADPNHRGVCTISAGTLELEHTGSTDAKFIINAGATLRNMGANQNLGDYDIQADGTFDVQVSDQIGGLLGSGTVTVGKSAAYILSVGGSNLSGIFSGVMQNGSGTLSFTKNGAGIQTLSGLSTYSGTTTLAAGQLNINNGGSSSANSAIGIGPFVITGGTIDNTSGADLTLSPNNTQSWNGNFTFAGSKSLNLGTGAVTMNAARTVTVLTNTLTVGGPISGSFSLTKAGAGTLILSGANLYNGGTTLSGGKLLVNSPGSLAAGAVTTSSGTVLGGSGSISGAVTLNANGLLAPGAEGAVGTLSLGSTLTLNGNPLLFDVSNVATDKVAIASALTLNGTNSVVLAFPEGEIQAGTYTLMTFASRAGTGSLVLSPAYPNCSLNISGTSVTLEVSNPAGFSGVAWTGNQSGNWNTGDPNWTNSSAVVVYTDGKGVTFDDTAIGNFTVTSDMDGVAPGAVLFNNNVNNYSITVPITNTAPLAKQGLGSATLSGINAYNPLSIMVGGGVLTLGGTSQLNNGLYAGDIFNNGAFIFASSASQTNSGVISGTGALTLSGGGIVTLSGANTYAGITTVSTGVLKIQTATGLGTTAAGTTVAMGATLELGGNLSIPAEALDLYGILSSPTGVNTYAGVVSLRAGSSVDVGSGAVLSLTVNTPNIGTQPFSKTGAGTLRLTVDPNHRGTCTVAEGTLELNAGTTDDAFIINPGATLRETAAALGDYRITANGIFDLRANDQIGALDGTGVVTIGHAVAYTFSVGGGNQSGLFSGVIENGSGTLSFTKNGIGTQILSGTNTYSGATAVNGGILSVDFPGSLAAGSAVTVANAAILGGNGTVNGPVTLSAGGALAPGGVSVIGTLTLGSSLTLNGNTLLFDLSNAAQDKVAVAAALTANGVNTVLVNGTVSAGDYILMTFASQTAALPFSLSGLSDASLELTDTNLVLHVTTGSSGSGLTWKGDKSAIWDGGIQNWINNSAPAAFAAGDAVLFDDTAVGNFTVNSGSAVSPASVLFNNSLNAYTVSASIGGATAISKLGTGTANLSGVNTYSGPTTISQGTLAITAAGQLGSGLYAPNILNLGTFTYASSAAQTLSGNISGSGGLTVSGSGTLTLTGSTNTLGTVIAGNANGDRSRLILSTDATMGKLLPGYAAGAAGSVIQTSGIVLVGTNLTGQDLLSLGTVGGYGYYRKNGGSLATGQLALTGNNNNINNNGVFDLFDGTVDVVPAGGWLIFGWQAGNGVFNVFGGSLYSPPGNNNATMAFTATRNSFGMMNLLGAAALLDVTGKGTARWFDLAAQAGNKASVLNLNAGVCRANKVGATVTTTPTYVNFNGGTLRANVTIPTFLQGLTAATIYPGGAVIDSTNVSVTVVQPLLAPTDYGVTSVNVTSGGAGYIGAPVVVISGGSGTNATAIAKVDLNPASGTFGRVTSIEVTSPGVRYQAGNVLTVTCVGGGYTTLATATATLGANSAAGGLTKLGSGTLTLSGTNTYAGATTISNGTVRLGIANALPTNSVVNLNGGVYDLNGFTVTNSSVNTTAGVIGNGSLNCAGINKNEDGLVTFTAVQTAAAPIMINGGTFSLGGVASGLFEGRVAGNANWTTPNPQTAVRLSPANAYLTFANSGASGGIWIDNSTYIYTGYIWNHSQADETWTFCKSFDDSGLIKVDGVEVINNGTYNATPVANYVVTPGPHTFEVRVGQGGGGVGQQGTVPGIGFDRLGRSTAALCVPIVDPGDGSLLTLFADPYAAGSLPKLAGKLADASTVELAANTMLDLGTTNQTLAGLSGSGTVSNGALTVTGEVSPAGTNAIGTLTAKANTTLSGTLVVDVATDGSGDTLVVEGDLTLLSPTLEVVDLQGLNLLKVYTLVTYTGTRTGSFTVSEELIDSRWALRYTADKKVQLYNKGGSILLIM